MQSAAAADPVTEVVGSSADPRTESSVSKGGEPAGTPPVLTRRRACRVGCGRAPHGDPVLGRGARHSRARALAGTIRDHSGRCDDCWSRLAGSP